jgi:hypothetical protein
MAVYMLLIMSGSVLGSIFMILIYAIFQGSKRREEEYVGKIESIVN